MKLFKYLRYLLWIGCLFSPVAISAASFKKISAKVYFDCPSISYENEKIVMPNCGKTDGSISGITIHSDGTKVTYTWRDANNAIVGKNADLPGIGEGTYRLEVSDNSGCANSVFSRVYVLLSANAISINDDNPIIQQATCLSSGSITGIGVTNATLYTWRDLLGKEYISTTSPDLLNAAPGTYKLTATNNSGCSAQSAVFTVKIQPNFDVPTVSGFTITNGSCDAATSIVLTLSFQPGGPVLNRYFTLANDPSQLRYNEGSIFTDKGTAEVSLINVDPGDYNFYVEKASGCRVLLGTYTVGYDNVSINIAKSLVSNDRCGQRIGGIVPVIDGLPPVGSTYKWVDVKTGKVVSNIKSLFRVGAGEYEFTARHGAACKDTKVFTVLNDSPPLPLPIVDGATLCLPGIAAIKVKDKLDTADTFKLYASDQDTVALDSNKFGEFYRKVAETTDFYVSRKRFDCESERVKVTEVVIASIDITNAFTPNNDGINDTWKIKGIEAFPDADVKVFDRYGHMVFSSVGYGVPFDGRSKGHVLPTGVYYYIVDVKQLVCYGKIAGSLTIIH